MHICFCFRIMHFAFLYMCYALCMRACCLIVRGVYVLLDRALWFSLHVFCYFFVLAFSIFYFCFLLFVSVFAFCFFAFRCVRACCLIVRCVCVLLDRVLWFSLHVFCYFFVLAFSIFYFCFLLFVSVFAFCFFAFSILHFCFYVVRGPCASLLRVLCLRVAGCCECVVFSSYYFIFSVFYYLFFDLAFSICILYFCIVVLLYLLSRWLVVRCECAVRCCARLYRCRHFLLCGMKRLFASHHRIRITCTSAQHNAQNVNQATIT